MKANQESIVMIGAGNLAHHLGPALKRAGYKILQIVSQTHASAAKLALQLNAVAEFRVSHMMSDANYYLFCVSDEQLEHVISESQPAGKFLVHCSGSTDISILKKYSSRYAVLYPLQTFTRGIRVNLKAVPIFIEASGDEELEKITRLASSISLCVKQANSDQRLLLHLSAVFCSNFTNHMYAIAERICQENGLAFEYLHPLLLETARKAVHTSPLKAQTGPAKRNDLNILEKHKALLRKCPEFQKIYTFVSDSIIGFHGKLPERP